MPGRLIPLINDQVYHVFNRGLDHRPTFIGNLELRRAMTTIDFYRFANPPMKLSKFLKLSNEEREKLTREMKVKDTKLVEIIAFCLMPNHFHFILKQVHANGISKFLANFQNSYTRYFNTKRDRIGQLFLDQFKAVRIETDEQLLHVSRYVHLNPITSYVVKNFHNLEKYSWSSLPEYLENKEIICKISTVLSFFKNIDAYRTFLKDQVNYQRELDKIKHLLHE